jgi:hypothetical protein
VKTQVTVLGVVCRSCWMTGSAGLTSDCNIENDATTVASTANVSRGFPDLMTGMQKSFTREFCAPGRRRELSPA